MGGSRTGEQGPNRQRPNFNRLCQKSSTVWAQYRSQCPGFLCQMVGAARRMFASRRSYFVCVIVFCRCVIVFFLMVCVCFVLICFYFKILFLGG